MRLTSSNLPVSEGRRLQPLVYVCVLNWNGHARTIACLTSLAALNYKRAKIVVVDNASQDESVALIQAAFPSVEMIVARENLGYAGGNALAVRAALEAHADLIWIVNNDVIVEPDTLDRLVDAYQQLGLALYGSISMPEPLPDRDIETMPLLMPCWELHETGEPDYRRLMWGQAYQNCFTEHQPRPVANLVGNSLLIPAEVVRRHGFMQTDYFLYWEEIDYSFRMRKEGIPSFLVPRSRVFHNPRHADKHDASLKPVMVYYNVRNRLIWSKRFRTRIAYIHVVLANVGFTFLRYAAIAKRGLTAFPVAVYATRGIADGILMRSGKTIAPEAIMSFGRAARQRSSRNA